MAGWWKARGDCLTIIVCILWTRLRRVARRNWFCLHWYFLFHRQTATLYYMPTGSHSSLVITAKNIAHSLALRTYLHFSRPSVSVCNKSLHVITACLYVTLLAYCCVSCVLSPVSTTRVGEVTARVDGWWKPVTRQLGPSTRVVETGFIVLLKRYLLVLFWSQTTAAATVDLAGVVTCC